MTGSRACSREWLAEVVGMDEVTGAEEVKKLRGQGAGRIIYVCYWTCQEIKADIALGWDGSHKYGKTRKTLNILGKEK